MNIDLIRHTTPDIAEGICYGQSDLALKPSYPQEFELIHGKLMPHYDRVISSPLQRCLQLAKTLETDSLLEDPRIMEYDFGDWELKPWAEFKTTQAQNWMNNFVDQPAPNGDSMVIMQTRVLQFWTELLENGHQNVAVVTHSGVQRLLHAHILQTPLKFMFRLELGFGAVIRVKHNVDAGFTTLKHL